MNLLLDPWIPVATSQGRARIGLKELLCSPRPYQVSLPRDDLELAVQQLAICLVQVIMPPKDSREAVERIESPLEPAIYDAAVAPFGDMFIVDHAEKPFMQYRGVPSQDTTPIQKFFPGLPEGNNAWLFNVPGEVSFVCPSCAAVALFHQASNCPNWSGKHKGGLRGGSPVTALVHDSNLRSCVWKNVMNCEWIERLYSSPQEEKPVWIEWWEAEKTYPAHSLGLLRGLFWQAVKIKLLWVEEERKCDSCGLPAGKHAVAFTNWASHMCTIDGVWPHPHSARYLGKDTKKNEVWRFVSYTTSVPAWARLPDTMRKTEGSHERPYVIEHYRSLGSSSPLSLIMGGYRTKQASIKERRYDPVPLPAGWGENMESLLELMDLALEIKTVLWEAVDALGVALGISVQLDKKKNKFSNLRNLAERLFFDRTEATIHSHLRELDWESKAEAMRRLAEELMQTCWSIFEALLEPYEHAPKTLKESAVTRRTLAKEFKRIKEELS